jgi:hypothetical protein
MDKNNPGEPQLIRPIAVLSERSEESGAGRIAVRLACAGLFCLLFAAAQAIADSYALSPDGSAVVRITPQTTLSASSFNTALLSGGYTATTGSSGSLSVTNYMAGFAGSGGAQFEALYNNGGPFGAGQNFEYIQVITTNSPLGNSVSPYLDNAPNPSQPFYSYQPANQLNFYDYSQRPTSFLKTTNPITWNASLYPVIVNANNAITLENGVGWGWTMKKATVGVSSAVFVNPSPSSAVVSGVGTNTFSTGSGESSSLSFAGAAFDTTPGTPFKLGTLTYHNGANVSAADTVDFKASVAFDNVPEKNLDLGTRFMITNTLNTSDPIASADFVTLGNFPYTFNVIEGDTASVDLMATLTTGLAGSPSGVSADSLVFSGPFDPSPNYTLQIVGLANPTPGGFLAPSIPLPPAAWSGLATLATLAVGATLRRRGRSTSFIGILN